MDTDESILQTNDFYIFIAGDHIFIEPKDPAYPISLSDVAKEIERCLVDMKNNAPLLGE